MNIVLKNSHKADSFTSLFQNIKLFTDHVNILFEKDRVYVQSMDSSRVSIFEINIPSAWFDVYEHTHPTAITIGISSSLFYKVMNTRDKNQELNIVYNDTDTDKLFINFTCGRAVVNTITQTESTKEGQKEPVVRETSVKSVFDKHFELPLMDIECDLMNIPEEDSQAEFTVPSGTFSSLINQLGLFGDTLEIDCSEEKIMLHSVSTDQGKMAVEMKIDDLTEYAINEGETMHISFSLKILHNICLYNKLSKDVVVHLTTNFPMKIVYDLGENAAMTFYLAPKIEDSDA
jgi:DNA polymerase III sliding clamp (beta) subunit (PCNA family)